MTNQKPQSEFIQSIEISNRQRLCVTNVKDVLAFDSEFVTLACDKAVLSVEGANLRIVKMDVQSGDLLIEGKIDALSYVDKRKTKSGLFGSK